MIFRDRREAGKKLAEKLTAYANHDDVLVLALPRGGVPVAYEVAKRLNSPLDIFLVRKLGVPGHEELKRVNDGLPGSYENLFHNVGISCFFLDLQSDAVKSALGEPMLERAIGVIYRPETERQSHYFTAAMSGQFDAVIHFDETRAVEPLDVFPNWDATDLPKTFPVGV